MKSINELKNILVKNGYDRNHIDDIFKENQDIFNDFFQIINESEIDLNEKNLLFLAKIYGLLTKSILR